MPDSSTNQTKWRSIEFWFVAGSLLFILYNYVMDIKTIIDYFRQGETVLFYFYLFWTALPTIFIHLFIFIRIRSNCSQFLSFLISPLLLSFKYLQVYGQSTPKKAVIERTRTVVTVVQCLFKAIPQLCIQSAAWWTGYQADSPIFFEGTTETTMHMLYKIHSVAFSLLADFSNDMPFYWRFINWIPLVPAYSCSRRSSLCKTPGGGLASFLLSSVSSRLGSSVSEQIKGGSQRRARRPCSSHPLTWRASSLPPCTWSSTERLSLRAKIVHLLNYLLCCSFTASQDVCGNTF